MRYDDEEIWFSEKASISEEGYIQHTYVPYEYMSDEARNEFLGFDHTVGNEAYSVEYMRHTYNGIAAVQVVEMLNDQAWGALVLHRFSRTDALVQIDNRMTSLVADTFFFDSVLTFYDVLSELNLYKLSGYIPEQFYSAVHAQMMYVRQRAYDHANKNELRYGAGVYYENQKQIQAQYMKAVVSLGTANDTVVSSATLDPVGKGSLFKPCMGEITLTAEGSSFGLFSITDKKINPRPSNIESVFRWDYPIFIGVSFVSSVPDTDCVFTLGEERVLAENAPIRLRFNIEAQGVSKAEEFKPKQIVRSFYVDSKDSLLGVCGYLSLASQSGVGYMQEQISRLRENGMEILESVSPDGGSSGYDNMWWGK